MRLSLLILGLASILLSPLPGSAQQSTAAPPANPDECVPACRTGYVCEQGVCISACNPPCAAGEQCTGNGECVAAAAPPPPSFISPEAVAPAPDPGAEAHDGFMLRLTLGLGYAAATESWEGTEVDFSGLSGSFSFDIGAAAASNFVIHARLADFVITDPTVSIDGEELGSAEDAAVAVILLAPAVSYYFMPANVYATAAFGVSWFNASNSDTDRSATSDAGFGMNLDVGKEWWASSNWGLGVAGRFWFSMAKEEDSLATTDLKFLGFAVLFSATYQ